MGRKVRFDFFSSQYSGPGYVPISDFAPIFSKNIKEHSYNFQVRPVFRVVAQPEQNVKKNYLFEPILTF